ncbi:23S rRNA (pseudouridine(1915)-N(3))-methyltransferase RlmH, partial [Neisseria gonorrhoeae]
MRLVVICIGRLKQGPERELAERYRERFEDIGRKLGFRGLEVHEIPESRARDTAARIAEEAAAISALLPEKHMLV